MNLSYLGVCNPHTNRAGGTRGPLLPRTKPATRSLPDELPYCSQEIGSVEVAFRVRGNPFGHARPTGVGIRTRIGDQVLHRAVFRIPDSNAPLDARVEPVAGLR